MNMGEGRIGCLIPLLVLFHFTNLVCGQQINVDAYKSELFIQKVSPDLMSWNDTERMNDFHCLVTSVEGPDLPSWILTTLYGNSVFIYGVVPKDFNLNILELLVSFTSLQSYRSKYSKVIISVLPKDEYALYEVRLRVINVNIDEILISNGRRDELVRIFEDKLWPEAVGKLYITYLTDSENEGFTLPPNPNDTLGVVVYLGATVNFSTQLYNIQNQTKPLSKHCPSSFHKRISAENYFSPKFIIDWCFFKLVNLPNDCFSISAESGANNPCKAGVIVTGYDDPVLTPFIDNELEVLTIKEDIPSSPIFKTLLTLVIVPSIVLCVFITCWLVFIMCLQSSRLYDRYSDDYFETVFFICEDCKRRQQKEEEERSTLGYNEYDPKEVLFHF